MFCSYNFETSTQGFTSTGGMLTSLASSADRAYLGARSLKLNFSGSAGPQRAIVSKPAVPAGAQLVVRLQYQANPTTMGVRDQGIVLEDNGETILALDHETTIFP